MEKCKSYKVTKQIVGWCNSQQPIHKIVYRCNSTKERDECSCGGDRVKCDFYPEVREQAKQEFSKGMTNSEYVRAMTDEELADFFFESPEVEFGICYYCRNFGGAASPEPCKTHNGFCNIADKNEAFKKWLKQVR